MSDPQTTQAEEPALLKVAVNREHHTSAPAVAGKAPAAVRNFLSSRGSGAGTDRAFGSIVLLSALSIIGIVTLILFMLIQQSKLSLHQFGIKFFFHSAWNPVTGDFGAWPFIYGTLITSFLALCIAVPLALCVSVFIMEICPKPFRSSVAFLTELLAAIPSVVYGLWAVFVLVPIMRDQLGPFLVKYFGWTGLFSGSNFGEGILTASIILSIMVLPVISSITREVMGAVPVSQKEGVLALGATRWEMIRIAVLRNARVGIVGGIILGLGRALGETMAVTMVIGNHPDVAKSLFAPGYTLASVIANEFTEATGDLYLSSLIEIGLALFLVTIVVNSIARLLVWFVTRGNASEAR
ncbi:MAG: phosphate ABC transporter permease subunit PstC [Acidobacteriaceae bacterium]|nr:phosphate ABC transporter permease subunit PstC [Acidobacteriaceae bacterium]